MEDAGAGHNRPPSPIEDAGAYARMVDEWQSKVKEIASEEEAEHASQFLDALTKKQKVLAAEMEAERQPWLDKAKPFLDEAAAVYSRYDYAIQLLKACVPHIKVLIRGWAQKKQAVIDAAAAAARAEAQRARDEAAKAAAEAAKSKSVEATFQAEQQAIRAAEADKAAKKAAAVRPQVKAVGAVRARSIRRTWFATLDGDNEDAVALACWHYADDPRLREVLGALASADALSGVREIPGFVVSYREDVA